MAVRTRACVGALTASLALTVPVVALAAPAHAAAATCGGLKATIVGDGKSNTLIGTAGRDVIVGGAGSDKIVGGDGNDVICGGDGSDAIYGGSGDDIIDGGMDQYWTDQYGLAHKRGDSIAPGGGNDQVTPGYDARQVSSSVTPTPDLITYTSAPAPVNVDLLAQPVVVTADGSDTLNIAAGQAIAFNGSQFDDVISGTYKNDVLRGMGGNDIIRGRDGDDTITPDGSESAGADTVDGGTGNDSIISEAGPDTLLGGGGEDVITSTSVNRLYVKGGGGIDNVVVPVPGETGFGIVGNGGQDRLRFTAYPNPALTPKLRIDQRSGKSTVKGVAPITLTGKFQSFTEVVLPPSTTSIYKGTKKGEVITANAEAGATIKARGGADVLTGSNEKDVLVGGKGFDIGYGKAGNDKCTLIERRRSC